MSRTAKFGAVLAVVVLIGTACGKKATTTTGSPSASASPSASPTAALACAGITPSNNTTPVTGGTVAIGMIGDLTGSNSALVVPGEHAAQLAIDQANASGKLKVKLKLIPEDNKEANPTTAPPLAQALISNSTVVGVIGPAFSGETSAVQPLFMQAGLTHVTQSATRASLTQQGCSTFFRSVGGDSDQADAAAKLAVKGKSCKNVAVVDDKSAYGQGFGDIAAASVTKYGGALATRQGVAPTQDYTSLVDTLTSKNPDCVIYGGYEPQSSILVKQMREKNLRSIFISGDGSKDPKFITDAGVANAEGVLFTCPCQDVNSSSDPAAKKFVSDFKAKFKVAPDIYAPEAYDVANIFINAIEACGTAITRLCVFNQVSSLKDYKGLTKTFNWTPVHEVTDREIGMFEIKSGKIVGIGKAGDLPS